MPIFKSKSLSAYILAVLGGVALLFLLSVFWILVVADWQAWNIGLTLVVLGLFLFMGIMRFKHRVMSSFDRALLHIEAVKVEDYNQYAKSEFKEGVTANFHNELTMLSEKMQTHKSQYDQHALLLYQLIDQLDTPMLVFNQKQKLTYANAAFSTLFGQPWQMYRLASPKLLGLIYTAKGWHLPSKDQQWHVSQSAFIDSGESHQLLVFTNIDSAIRASQLHAWQQIIRVMGHEIRNSLTPVSSLAESLGSKLNSTREKQALAVISERCHHLQDFVNRYSSLSQTLNLELQQINVAMFVERLKGLFSQNNLIFANKSQWLWADPTFIEQVFINLLKNAFEAQATQVKIEMTEKAQKSLLKIIDDGHGLANTENLFVPLFTTKQQGQGIGLTFCRNIVEQHGGSIEIKNNAAPAKGMTVFIALPLSASPPPQSL
ncbi:PAS domain-containing sensor histidine kinase [Paraglaciecola sp. MB-3u-78]|uniref:sensor histidine kinase n=1 Tax=Paraglaciecola sp. MB-3u-78 TaxID=2058332 RepID=UPI000C3381F9|nr:PAS domain-containing sensor histidine kinase [Paraglaciecola sp. MB-3u-78]PKG93233.1 sensor histidine kinase [Paraglaciecola sp. MB-3u-78]